MQSNDAAINELTECPDAYKNPVCPYVTQINFNTNCMHNVEKALTALLGEDGTGLNTGVIHDIKLQLDCQDSRQKIETSWIENAKPIIYTAIGVVVTAIITWALTVHL